MTWLARELADRIALVMVRTDGSEQTMSWTDLDGHALRTACSLAARGVTQGSVVALALPNSIAHVVLNIAAWKLGATVLPLDSRAPIPERDRMVALAGPGTLVIDEWPEPTGAPGRDPGDQATSAPIGRVADPARMIGSGGSSGSPKLVVVSGPSGGIPGDLGHYPRTAGARENMVQLVVGPLHHSMPHGWLHFGLFHRHTIVLMEHFEPALALDLIERHRVSMLVGVPTHLIRMLRTPSVTSRDLSSLESVRHSGGPCPAWAKQGWIDLIGADRIYEAYGATENIGTTAIRGDEWLRHRNSVGRPIDCEIRIMDSDGREQPAGVAGLVHMRCYSGSAPHRYRGQPPLRDRNGFHTVGDLGWVDSEGYLYLADRAENVVVSGGVSVYPAEVEAALLLHPDIEDAMVVGVPDDELGHRVHALIQGRPDSGRVEIGPLRAWCQHHLSPAKLPRSLEMVPVVPRNAAGKMQRHKGEL